LGKPQGLLKHFLCLWQTPRQPSLPATVHGVMAALQRSEGIQNRPETCDRRSALVQAPSAQVDIHISREREAVEEADTLLDGGAVSGLRQGEAALGIAFIPVLVAEFPAQQGAAQHRLDLGGLREGSAQAGQCPSGLAALADIPDVVEEQVVEGDQVQIRRAIALQQLSDSAFPGREFRMPRSGQNHQVEHPEGNTRFDGWRGEARVAGAQPLEFHQPATGGPKIVPGQDIGIGYGRPGQPETPHVSGVLEESISAGKGGAGGDGILRQPALPQPKQQPGRPISNRRRTTGQPSLHQSASALP